MIHAHRHNWGIGIVAGVIALAALVGSSEFGKIDGSTHQKLVAWIGAAVLLVSGVIATRRIAAAVSHVPTLLSVPAAGSAVRLLATGVGYVFVIFAVLAVLEVSIEHLLVGAGLAGVVLGIAAQQSLGNVFAGLVLLLTRPFKVGDYVRIRSGALGGIFEAWVREVSLTYVTLQTDEGLLKIPNSGMLAAGVGLITPPDGGPASPQEPVVQLPVAPEPSERDN